MNGETSKKVTSAARDCCLCKDKIPSLKEKVKIFCKSELQIGALIHRSLGVDLGVYTGSENLAICCLCYNMLNAYNKALKKSTRSLMASSRNLKVTDLSVSKDYRTPTRRLKFHGDHHNQQAISLQIMFVCLLLQSFRQFLVLVPLAQLLHSRFFEHQIV